ncbi:MAG TPA: hypothetical protein VG755_05020 [Nannocystaceae bacterium]|nr:hypothetical protein [Nannocystaceae bacterium]
MALTFFLIELPALVPSPMDEWIDREELEENRFQSCCMCFDEPAPPPPIEPNPALVPDLSASFLDGRVLPERHPELVHLHAEAIALHDGIALVVRVDGIPARIVDFELGAGGEWTSISGVEAWDDRATAEHGSAVWVFALPHDATRSSLAVTTARFDVVRRTGTWVEWHPTVDVASESARHAIARTLSSLQWPVHPS